MIDIPDFVYPKDANGNPLCPRCQKAAAHCDCPSGEAKKLKPVVLRPSIRLDKSGRRGKVVTLIGALPQDEMLLKGLAKKLKVKTGSGGTFYLSQDGGCVEIQGDHKDALIEFFGKGQHV